MPSARQRRKADHALRLLGIRKGRYWIVATLAGIIVLVNALGVSSNPGAYDSSSAVKETETLQAKVSKVSDGDTVHVIDNDGRRLKIRLLGIDAPERNQAHGLAATQWLTDRALNRPVQVQVTDTDRYGRLVAKLLAKDQSCRDEPCPFNQDLNLKLVQLGHAWWYEAYQEDQPPSDRPLYQQAQLQAQTERLGLWSKPEPIAPWQWRQTQRELRSQ